MKWQDLELDNEFSTPSMIDIYTYPIVICFIFIIFRSFILDMLILEPLANKLGLKKHTYKLPFSSSTLENIFIANNGCVPSKVVAESSFSLKLTTRQVERWLRTRRQMTKLTKMDKFQDSGYILLYHTMVTIYGISVLFNKKWLWNIGETCKDYPYHEVDDDIWWYYIISCGFYWSQTVWQLKFRHGKDAIVGYFHHIVTICLMMASWAINSLRIGSLILLVHECGDIPLQIAKMCKYVDRKSLIDTFYWIFVGLWLTTRVVLYPFWILRTIFIGECVKYVILPSITIFHILLLSLMVLNIIWTCFLVLSVYRRLTTGFVENVVSSEETDDIQEKNDKPKEN